MTSSQHQTPQQAWDSLREGNQRLFQRVLVEKVTPSLLSAKKRGMESSDAFERNHVAEIADHIVDRSPEIQARLADNRCAVVGLRYRLSDGLA
ncbi:hypothetical protein CYJ76_11785, partial [Kytococcus schroeteri]